jgi:hypothetical protein
MPLWSLPCPLRSPPPPQEVKKRIDAKNGLESYLYNLKNMLEDTEKGVADKISETEKVRSCCEPACSSQSTETCVPYTKKRAGC